MLSVQPLRDDIHCCPNESLCKMHLTDLRCSESIEDGCPCVGVRNHILPLIYRDKGMRVVAYQV